MEQTDFSYFFQLGKDQFHKWFNRKSGGDIDRKFKNSIQSGDYYKVK